MKLKFVENQIVIMRGNNDLEKLAFSNWASNPGTETSDKGKYSLEALLTELRNNLTNQTFCELGSPFFWALNNLKTNPSSEKIDSIIAEASKGLIVLENHGLPFCFLEDVFQEDVLLYLQGLHLRELKERQRRCFEIHEKVEDSFLEIETALVCADFENGQEVVKEFSENVTKGLYQMVQDIYSLQMDGVYSMLDDICEVSGRQRDDELFKCAVVEKIGSFYYESLYNGVEQKQIQFLGSFYEIFKKINLVSQKNFPEDVLGLFGDIKKSA